MLLIVTNKIDAHADEVIRRLAARVARLVRGCTRDGALRARRRAPALPLALHREARAAVARRAAARDAQANVARSAAAHLARRRTAFDAAGRLRPSPRRTRGATSSTVSISPTSSSRSAARVSGRYFAGSATQSRSAHPSPRSAPQRRHATCSPPCPRTRISRGCAIARRGAWRKTADAVRRDRLESLSASSQRARRAYSVTKPSSPSDEEA